MLMRESITSAVPLAQQLNTNGLALMAAENTPLAALCKESTPDFGYSVTQDPSVQAQLNDQNYLLNRSVDDIEYRACTVQPGTDIMPHAMVMEEIVPTIAAAVRQHVSFARNTVLPVLEEMVTRVKERIEGMTVSSLLGVEVVVFNPPAPFLNGVFENSIKKYNETTYDPAISLPGLFHQLTNEQLMELMKTNATALDADIQVWLNERGEGFLAGVWASFFVGDNGSITLHNYITGQASSYGRSNLDVDRLLAVHLLARGLFENPPEGIDLSLDRYNLLMADLRNSTGARLFMENEAYYNEVGKQKILVRSVVGDLLGNNNKCIVNGEVYKQWIAAGGENEVLFGYLLVDNLGRDVDSINEKKDYLLGEWKRHCALVSSAEANRRFIRVKDALYSVFREQLVQADESEGINKENCLKLFTEQLDQVRESDMDSIYTLSLRLVTRSRYAHTDAELILENINRVSKENPSLSIREAAAIAVIEYISYWVADQFKVV